MTDTAPTEPITLPSVQAANGMDLIGEWVTGPEEFQLYSDDYAGEAHLLRTSEFEPAEHVATFFYSGGVTRATVWRGSAGDRTGLWREAQRTKAAALIAAGHAGRP